MGIQGDRLDTSIKTLSTHTLHSQDTHWEGKNGKVMGWDGISKWKHIFLRLPLFQELVKV